MIYTDERVFMTEEALNAIKEINNYEDAVIIDTEEIDLEFNDKAVYEIITCDSSRNNQGIYIRVGW